MERAGIHANLIGSESRPEATGRGGLLRERLPGWLP
jgi:hypothetical protein